MDIKIGDIVYLKEWAGQIRNHKWDTGNLDRDISIQYIVEDIDYECAANSNKDVVKIGGTAFRAQYLRIQDPMIKQLEQARKIIYTD